MSEQYSNEALLELFIFETTQLLEQLEEMVITSESNGGFWTEEINEIFRVMHTIKGSAAMMQFQYISTLAHTIEDVFFILRENSAHKASDSVLSDLLLESIDFIKLELVKIINNLEVDGNPTEIIEALKKYHDLLKDDQNANRSHSGTDNFVHNKNRPKETGLKTESKDKETGNSFEAVIFFEEDCGMEHIRAYTVIHELKDYVDMISCQPENIETDESIESIQKNGFRISLKTDMEFEELHQLLMGTIFLKELELRQLAEEESDCISCEIKEIMPETELAVVKDKGNEEAVKIRDKEKHAVSQSMISVSVAKLDKLMDLMGELVITEAMVLQNPDLQGLHLDKFQKAARQLSKITGELQDTVMAIRMVPLSATFHKMYRIVRDMSKKLEKEVNLTIEGEETEVDKNIIEHISDPLMHLVRNALDHGIESPEERIKKGKTASGTIVLKAENSGSDVLITIKDDGRGLNKDKILTKAKQSGLLQRPEEDLTDREIYNLIFLPGFSTNEQVTEFSGRGVGMDVVMKNIETIGGSLAVESQDSKGSMIILKIPLTLAIIDGMNLSVGDSCYTIPTLAIRESFRPRDEDIITDPEGNEMILIRGKVYQVIRLHRIFKVKTKTVNYSDGIIVMVQQEEKVFCLFADRLIGQQQVVVKSLPEYIRKVGNLKGLGGCTLLGDGSISVILDIAGLI